VDRYLWYLSISLHILISQKTVIFINVHILGTKTDLHYGKQNKSWQESEKKNCGKTEEIGDLSNIVLYKMETMLENGGKGEMRRRRRRRRRKRKGRKSIKVCE
jgi:hypothetical protein